MPAQPNTNTQCKSDIDSYSYTYFYGNTQCHAYGYAEIYSVAEAAPYAASAPKPVMG